MSSSKQRLMLVIEMQPNPALNLAPFGRWTLRDKAAQRRLALRYPTIGTIGAWEL
ncbi:hypothetical protein SAMN04244573_03409 [Azotobacter beijerinckii]|uniref:Uncharacterized protein n=1 Tax=Azotobacter beijerinckii TaxID=170623 RepID=A0A1H9NE16_9GAMM|nr:hypothetical protein [Azotobacter beijerinckii]SER33879.1 hypothetical protein SAMN04244573_03409 [Azotobacter beijerinckii]